MKIFVFMWGIIASVLMEKNWIKKAWAAELQLMIMDLGYIILRLGSF
jgi:hypothetical protein